MLQYIHGEREGVKKRANMVQAYRAKKNWHIKFQQMYLTYALLQYWSIIVYVIFDKLYKLSPM